RGSQREETRQLPFDELHYKQSRRVRVQAAGGARSLRGYCVGRRVQIRNKDRRGQRVRSRPARVLAGTRQEKIVSDNRDRSNSGAARESADEANPATEPDQPDQPKEDHLREKKTEYLTAHQLAAILQVSEATIHRLRKSGRIPAVLLTDRLIRFNLKDVQKA